MKIRLSYTGRERVLIIWKRPILMVNESDVPQAQERRQLTPDKHVLWNQLNVCQQASVSSLYSYGYELSFIRISSEGKIAVMILNGTPIVIDDEGSINPHPEIHIRQ